MTATATHRSLRWTALLTGLLLILGATVASSPAHANDKTYSASIQAGDPSGESPAAVEFTLSVTNTTTTSAQGLAIGSINVGLPSGVAGPDGSGTIEFRSLGLTPGASTELTFTATAVCAPPTAHAFSVAAKQSNDFQGSGNDFSLDPTAGLTVSLDCSDEPSPPDTGPTPQVPAPTIEVLGEQSVSAQLGGQVVTVTGSSDGTIELSFPEDDTAQLVDDACQALIDAYPDRPARLAPNAFELVPSGFQAGDELTVTSTVPGEHVTQRADYRTVGTGDFQVGEAPGDALYVTADELRERLVAIRDNRGLPPESASDDIWIERILAGSHIMGDARTAISAKGAHEAAAAFQLCFVGEKEDHGSVTGLARLPDTDPELFLFGPVLLEDCSDDVAAPCIESREKDGDDVTIVATIPAEDPWMR